MPISLAPASLRDLNDPCPELRTGLMRGFPDREEGRRILAELLGIIANRPYTPPWGCYWGRCGGSKAYVGLCAFKADPDPSLSVEIAYFTFPRCEGRGFATGMATALAALARSSGAREVLAHTLPVRNASGTVLTRAGFTFRGEADDPEDGRVWRWSLPGV